MLRKILILILFFLISTNAFSAKKLIVVLDWFTNPDHAPLVVAQQQGFFKQQGLEVELIGPADPSDPPKWVAAGKADIAIDYQPHLLVQVDQGLPLIQIGTLINKPLNCLVVLADSPIKSIADLKGKSIGSSNNGMNAAMLKIMLAKNDIKITEVQSINIHYNLTQALLSGKVDAVTGIMRNFEMIQMELAGHPARAFYPEDNGMPSYSELVFIVKNTQTNDPRLAPFLSAVQQGLEYLKKHPEETWKAFAKQYPESNDELNHRAWFETIVDFTNHPAQIDAKQLLQFAAFMKENGLIKNIQPLRNYILQG